MTFCIAWKEKSNVHFLSDSRLYFDEQKNYVDRCIKIFSVPVTIWKPIGEGGYVADYEHNLGLCSAGGVISFYILKEYIYEILQHIYYNPDKRALSMELISEIIFKHYKSISNEIASILTEKGLSSFFVTGYCPEKQKVRTYKFSVEKKNILNYRYFEVLINNGYEFLGARDAQVKAMKIMVQTPSISKFKLMNKIINDENIKSVGGDIQYAKTDYLNKRFEIYGIVKQAVNSSISTEAGVYLRGGLLYKTEGENDEADYGILLNYINSED